MHSVDCLACIYLTAWPTMMHCPCGCGSFFCKHKVVGFKSQVIAQCEVIFGKTQIGILAYLATISTLDVNFSLLVKFKPQAFWCMYGFTGRLHSPSAKHRLCVVRPNQACTNSHRFGRLFVSSSVSSCRTAAVFQI